MNIAQYLDSLISASAGVYAILLGLGVNLPPKQYRGRKIAIILGVLIMLGAGATFLSSPTHPAPNALQVVEEMKQKIRLPMQVDDITRLEDLKADGHKVIYVIRILKDSAEATSLAGVMAQQLPKTACSNKDYLTLLKNGITVEIAYIDSANGAAGTITISPQNCGF